jgi:hypothetical protein
MAPRRTTTAVPRPAHRRLSPWLWADLILILLATELIVIVGVMIVTR